MWFPDDIWLLIGEFLFPVWKRNPWLKKYNKVVAKLPNYWKYDRPCHLIKFSHNLSIKFNIALTYLNRFGEDDDGFPQKHRLRCHRIIKVYTIEYL